MGTAKNSLDWVLYFEKNRVQVVNSVRSFEFFDSDNLREPIWVIRAFVLQGVVIMAHLCATKSANDNLLVVPK